MELINEQPDTLQQPTRENCWKNYGVKFCNELMEFVT